MTTPWFLYHVNKGYGDYGGKFHDGWDFGAPSKTPLISLTGGKVTSHTGWYPWGGEIDTKGGLLGAGVTETFAHADRIDVKPGQTIYPGQQVGLSGGENLPKQYSDGPHVHYSLFGGAPWDNSKAIDPSTFLGSVRNNGVGTALGSLGATGDVLADQVGKLYSQAETAIGKMVKRIGWLVLGMLLVLLGLWLLYSKTMSAVAYRAANDAAPILGKAAML
jgi:murein DD-endopeptidase MepM/ murein hydrolase activator NlpD